MSDEKETPPTFGGLPPVEPTADIPAWTPPFELGGRMEIVEPAPKRRRRRTPPKGRPEPEPEEEKTPPAPEDIAKLSMACAAGFQVGFRMIAATRGPHWVLNEHESRDLGALWGEALAPYMGKLSGYMAFGIAALRTFDVVSGRVAKDKVAQAETVTATVVTNNGDTPSANAD